MKHLIAVCFVCLLAFSLYAQTTQTLSLGSFSVVDVAGDFKTVVLVPGEVEKVTLEGSAANLEKTDIEVKGNHLEIKMEKENYSARGISVRVTYKAISEINNAGSTDVVTQGALRAKKLRYNGAGSGDFTAELDVDAFEASLAGSGDLELSGKASRQTYSMAGSGDVNASALRGADAEVSVAGSGDVRLSVSGNVRSSVSGSGKVVNNQ